MITDINILLLQEMKPPQGSRSALVYPQQPNLLLSAWEKGRLYNTFYITIRIYHFSTQFPSQTSTRELSLFTIKWSSWCSKSKLYKAPQNTWVLPTRHPIQNTWEWIFDQSNNSVVNSKIGYLQNYKHYSCESCNHFCSMVVIINDGDCF